MIEYKVYRAYQAFPFVFYRNMGARPRIWILDSLSANCIFLHFANFHCITCATLFAVVELYYSPVFYCTACYIFNCHLHVLVYYSLFAWHFCNFLQTIGTNILHWYFMSYCQYTLWLCISQYYCLLQLSFACSTVHNIDCICMTFV